MSKKDTGTRDVVEAIRTGHLELTDLNSEFTHCLLQRLLKPHFHSKPLIKYLYLLRGKRTLNKGQL